MSIADLDDLINDIQNMSMSPRGAGFEEETITFGEETITMPTLSPLTAVLVEATPSFAITAAGDDVEHTVSELDQLVAEFDGIGASGRRNHAKEAIPRAPEKSFAAGVVDENELTEILISLGTRVIKGVDIEKLARGSCAYCKKAIIVDITESRGLRYHPEHFFCEQCHKPSANGKYIEKGDKVFCQACFEGTQAPKCPRCSQAIVGQGLKAMGSAWHPDCFVCTLCGGGFPNGRYCEYENRPFCESCFKSKFAVCRSCKQPIQGTDYIQALDAMWHPEHFACQTCRKPFGPNFYQHEGLIYCEQHYLDVMNVPRCGLCNEPISGKVLSALGKNWHPDHFVCGLCTTPLGPDYKSKGDKGYCRKCFVNIDGF
jgi:paxillin